MDLRWRESVLRTDATQILADLLAMTKIRASLLNLTKFNPAKP